jgi:membrane protein
MPLQLNPKMLVKLRQNTAFLTALAVVAALAAAFAAAVLIVPVKGGHLSDKQQLLRDSLSGGFVSVKNGDTIQQRFTAAENGLNGLQGQFKLGIMDSSCRLELRLSEVHAQPGPQALLPPPSKSPAQGSTQAQGNVQAQAAASAPNVAAPSTASQNAASQNAAATPSPTTTQVASQSLPCAQVMVNESGTKIMGFKPIANSKGKTYQVALSVKADKPTVVVTRYYNPVSATDPDRPNEKRKRHVDNQPNYQVKTGEQVLKAGGATLNNQELAGREENLRGTGEITTTSLLPIYSDAGWWGTLQRGLQRSQALGPWWVSTPALVIWFAATAVSAVAAAVLAVRRSRWTVALVGAFALFQALVWAAVIPIFNGMDEYQHVSYIQYLATHNGPDSGLTQGKANYSPQLVHAYEASNLFYAWGTDRFDYSQISSLNSQLNQLPERALVRPQVTQYPPGYYLAGALVYKLSPHTGLSQYYDVRLLSVALAVVGALGMAYFARQLFPRRALVATLVSMSALAHPMMAHQSAIINNDILVISASIWALALATRALNAQRPLRWLAGAGVVTGIAMAKPQGILIAAMVALALIVVAVRARSFKLALKGGLLSGGGFIAVYIWWPIYRVIVGFGSVIAAPRTQVNLVNAGGGLAMGAVRQRGLGEQWQLFWNDQSADDYALFKARWIKQFFGNFGWLDVFYPTRIYHLLAQIMTLFALVCLLWVAQRCVRLVLNRLRPLAVKADDAAGVSGDVAATDTAQSSEEGAVVAKKHAGRQLGAIRNQTATWIWWCLALTVGYLVAINLLGFIYSIMAGHDDLLQGRYILPAVAGLYALPALLTQAAVQSLQNNPWRPVRGAWLDKLVPAVALAVFAAVMALNLAGLGVIFERFYV